MVGQKKKKTGTRSKAGKIKSWGLVDVDEATYALAVFRNKVEFTFRAYEFDKDGILHVQPISQWTVSIDEKGILSSAMYREMAEAIASKYFDVYSIRGKKFSFADIDKKRGPVTIYGYCA